MANPGTELSSIDFGNLIGGPLNAVITAQSMAARSTADFIKTVGFDKDNNPVYVDFKYPKEIQPYQPEQAPRVVSAKVSTAGSGYAANQVVNVTFAATTGTATIQATGTVKADALGNIPLNTLVEITAPGSYTAPSASSVAVSATVDAPASGTTALINTVNVSALVPASAAVFQEMKFSVPILTMLPIPFIKVDLATIDFNAKIVSMETKAESSDLAIAGSLEVKQRWPGGAAKLNVSCSFKKSNSSGSSVERTYSMAIHVQASQDEMPAGMEKLLNLLESAMISTPGKIEAKS
jgi:hypothetical protein